MAETTKTTKAAPKKAPTVPKPAAQGGKLLAAVLLRGMIGARHDVRKALAALRLGRKFICVVVPDNASNRGAMFLAKDFITFGPITPEVLEELRAKRGSLKDSEGKELNVFRMPPPRGGFGKKGTKAGYQQGGELGLRPEGMADLLRRMM